MCLKVAQTSKAIQKGHISPTLLTDLADDFSEWSCIVCSPCNVIAPAVNCSFTSISASKSVANISQCLSFSLVGVQICVDPKNPLIVGAILTVDSFVAMFMPAYLILEAARVGNLKDDEVMEVPASSKTSTAPSRDAVPLTA